MNFKKLINRTLFYKYKTKTKNFNKFFTIPNFITIIRSVLCLYFLYLFTSSQKTIFLYLSLIIFIIGDVLDGFISRKFGTESISGAILDIIADRLVYPIYYFFISLKYKEFGIIFFLFILSFNFFDFYLSINFLRLKNVESINYFYKFNERIYFLNFTPIAKFFNSGLLLVLSIIYVYFYKNIFLYYIIICYLSLLLIIKLYSIYLLEKILTNFELR